MASSCFRFLTGALAIASIMTLTSCKSGAISGTADGDLDADAQVMPDADGYGDDGADSFDAGSDPGADPGADPGPADAGEDAGQDGGDGGAVEPLGTLSGVIRVDNFGWRPGERKIALVLGRAASTVELHRITDNSLAASFVSSSLVDDEDSLDQLSLVDFSSIVEPGSYYLYLPGDDLHSYTFVIDEQVYDVVGMAAMKSFYFQRCNHDKALPYASDDLPGHPGRGGEWTDGACHLGDLSAPAGPGSADHGPLDLHGGWHDAGDYQKTLWGRGVPEMLLAYELNPGAWSDGQLDIPESGNGVPDILDELAWELDFYLRMQRPDGHFMTSVKGNNETSSSPPSSSDQGRVYFDCTAPSGNGWSGGGTTIGEASGNAVMCLAQAALVYAAAGQSAAADSYRAAALSGWNWLAAYSPQSDAERRVRAAAAAAVYRLEPTTSSAGAVVDAFDWEGWDGLLPWSVTPGERVIAAGAWQVLQNDQASDPLKQRVRTGVAAIVERAFSQEGAYGGMFGDSSDGWDWGWGSNSHQAMYGANLLVAAHFGIFGSHSQAEVVALAQKHLHFLLGLNPLNMVYLTNMAAYGGEHSSFQLYHGWFSHTGNDGDHGNAQYNGKPDWVDEPMYPYYPDDDQTSTYGPAPGLVPGGPNFYYSCAYDIPNRNRPAYAYRDFSVGCDWDGSACAACSWEITEPMAAYQGPFVLLASFVMSGG